MTDSECGSGKFSKNVGAGFVVIFVRTDQPLHISFSDQFRKVLIKSNVLNQANDVISGDLEYFFISKGFIFFQNEITKPIVLSDENGLKSCEGRIFFSSDVSSQKSSFIIFR